MILELEHALQEATRLVYDGVFDNALYTYEKIVDIAGLYSLEMIRHTSGLEVYMLFNRMRVERIRRTCILAYDKDTAREILDRFEHHRAIFERDRSTLTSLGFKELVNREEYAMELPLSTSVAVSINREFLGSTFVRISINDMTWVYRDEPMADSLSRFVVEDCPKEYMTALPAPIIDFAIRN